MAEQIKSRMRQALASIPEVFRVTCIQVSTGQQVSGIASTIETDVQLSLYGADDDYIASVRVNQDDVIIAPKVGDVWLIQNKQAQAGPTEMVERRILGIAPDAAAATLRIDYGAKYHE